jgi:hypothetical protein
MKMATLCDNSTWTASGIAATGATMANAVAVGSLAAPSAFTVNGAGIEPGLYNPKSVQISQLPHNFPNYGMVIFGPQLASSVTVQLPQGSTLPAGYVLNLVNLDLKFPCYLRTTFPDIVSSAFSHAIVAPNIIRVGVSATAPSIDNYGTILWTGSSWIDQTS